MALSPMAAVLVGAGGALGARGNGVCLEGGRGCLSSLPVWDVSPCDGKDGVGGREAAVLRGKDPSVVPPMPWGSCSSALSPSFTCGSLQPPMEPAALPVPQGDWGGGVPLAPELPQFPHHPHLGRASQFHNGVGELWRGCLTPSCLCGHPDTPS